MKKFSFDALPDVVSPKDLIEAGFPGGKNGIYAIFHRADLPVIRHGKRLLVSKAALMALFGA